MSNSCPFEHLPVACLTCHQRHDKKGQSLSKGAAVKENSEAKVN